MNTNEILAPKDQLFRLFLDDLQKAHDIYRQHCFENDFVNRCADRRQDEIGMCNLPYKTLPEEQELLSKAYRIFCDVEDCNVSYNDTLDFVIDEIEQQIDTGDFTFATELCPQVAVLIEDGIISAAYASDPKIQIQIVELDKNYASSEEREKAYQEFMQNDSLQETEYSLSIPGYEETMGMEVDK